MQIEIQPKIVNVITMMCLSPIVVAAMMAVVALSVNYANQCSLSSSVPLLFLFLSGSSISAWLLVLCSLPRSTVSYIEASIEIERMLEHVTAVHDRLSSQMKDEWMRWLKWMVWMPEQRLTRMLMPIEMLLQLLKLMSTMVVEVSLPVEHHSDECVQLELQVLPCCCTQR